jgi:hypothetical protein
MSTLRFSIPFWELSTFVSKSQSLMALAAEEANAINRGIGILNVKPVLLNDL